MNNIQDTGIRGYLKWLQQDQPGLYQLAAPQIARLLPQAFSNHEQSQAMGALMGLANDYYTPPIIGIGVDIPNVSNDVSNAADSGSSTPDVTSGISSIIDSIVGAYQAKTNADITKQNADVYRQITQAQLQRAQMGIGPLSVQSGQYGIPTITAAASKAMLSGTGLAIGAMLLIGGLALLGKHR